MATIKWALDPTHSEVLFKVKHLMITNVTGSFKSFNVTAETSDEQLSNASIQFTAKTSSIDTNNEQRDGHLKSPDFFDAEKFPEIKFASDELKKTAKGDYELTGKLTIKGITKDLKLNVEFAGIAKDPYGNVKAGFTITGSINRNDFGLTWNAALETGGVMVSEEVKLVSEIQLVKQK